MAGKKQPAAARRHREAGTKAVKTGEKVEEDMRGRDPSKLKAGR